MDKKRMRPGPGGIEQMIDRFVKRFAITLESAKILYFFSFPKYTVVYAKNKRFKPTTTLCITISARHRCHSKRILKNKNVTTGCY